LERIILEKTPPIALAPAFRKGLQDKDLVEQTILVVEHTRGPILLISGQDDQMWPSAELAEIAVRRLARHGFAFPFEHLSYPDAGHLVFMPPYLPTTIHHSHHPVRRVDVSFGGTPAADALARADSWPKVLKFLRTNLP
jgi:dienelactone hydrolase